MWGACESAEGVHEETGEPEQPAEFPAGVRLGAGKKGGKGASRQVHLRRDLTPQGDRAVELGEWLQHGGRRVRALRPPHGNPQLQDTLALGDKRYFPFRMHVRSAMSSCLVPSNGRGWRATKRRKAKRSATNVTA